MKCKNCRKEKEAYGVWVNGKCHDCMAVEVLEGREAAECSHARAHLETCAACRNSIKPK